jgi:hypothetical protein
MKRKDGYYWVLSKDGKWFIAFWENLSNCFWANSCCFEKDSLLEINENEIVRHDMKPDKDVYNSFTFVNKKIVKVKEHDNNLMISSVEHKMKPEYFESFSSELDRLIKKYKE